VGVRGDATRRRPPPTAGQRLGYHRPVLWTRNCLAISLGLAPVACGDDGASGQDTEAADTGTSTATPNTDGPDPTDPDGTGGCVPGQAGCSCLDDQCVSGAYCVEELCALGPLIEIDTEEEHAVLGGLVVPLEAEVTADEFSWSQVSGPAVEILGAATLQIAVVVPADAPPGEEVVLQLSATRNGVTLTADVPIEILDAVFEDALPTITDPTQLGTTEGLAFGPTDLWVASSEGFVSQFSSDGEFIARHDVPGEPVGMDFNGENLLIANREGTGRIDQLNSASGTLSTLFDALGGGGPLGEVNLPLVDDLNDDLYDVYVSTRLGQTVLRWSSELGTADVFLEDMGVINPNALTFGPDGGYLFVGAQGHVWRVPMLDGNVAGTPEDYLVLGDDSDITYEVDGLVFDEGSNLWVGCPNASTLFVAHYSAMGPAEISRTFADVGPGISRFVNLSFGRNDFEEDTLYYSNLSDGTVGRLRVGLQAL
jgi:hypothetical protein